MTDQNRFEYLRRRLVSQNSEIDACERKLRLLVAGRVRLVQELRSACSHKRIIEFRDSGSHDSGDWEHRDRFCLDCGDRERLTDLSSPVWVFEKLTGDPGFEADRRHFTLFLEKLHVEGRLDAVVQVIKKKAEKQEAG